MANERDEEREDRPRIVDNRLLSDNERQGLGSSAEAGSSIGGGDEAVQSAPHLEVIGGGADDSGTDAALAAVEGDDEGEEFDEEALREQIEAAIAEQLEAASQQLGRPLTGKERDQVRQQVEAQVQAQLAAAQGGGNMQVPLNENGEEMSPEEQEALRVQMEEEQFAAIQQQIGRDLTDQEKDQVRAQMEEQAQAAISLEVAPVLLDLMVKLPNYAAVHLGLTPNPYTQLIARNDGNARLSIEALGSMFDIIKPMLDNPSRREFERVIADLRANYTRITGQPIGPTGGPSLITGPRLIR